MDYVQRYLDIGMYTADPEDQSYRELLEEELGERRAVFLTGSHFDAGDGIPFLYLLVMRGGGEPEDNKTYRVAFLMNSYTEEAGAAYNAQVKEGAIRDIMRDWLSEQKTVSPSGNPWN